MMLRSAVLLLAATAIAAAEPNVPAFAAGIDGEVLHANVVRWLGLNLHDVAAKPVLDRQVLRFADCTARAYRGTVTATMIFDLAAETQSFQLNVADVDLATFLSEFAGVANGTAGIVSGTLDLSVAGGKVTGTGDVSVRNGTLVQMGPLSSLLAGDPTRGGGRDQARARLVFDGGRVQFKGGIIESPGVVVKLHGSIGFDGTVDLVLIPYPEFALIQVVPGVGDALSWLLGSASSRLARAAVRGHISKPAIVLSPFAQ
ncbi:MAG: YdbH domain-containing protein [Planctomycetes bacterium]|nr:YdbH domain-containing protein [Planctomycetota bacterium]